MGVDDPKVATAMQHSTLHSGSLHEAEASKADAALQHHQPLTASDTAEQLKTTVAIHSQEPSSAQDRIQAADSDKTRRSSLAAYIKTSDQCSSMQALSMADNTSACTPISSQALTSSPNSCETPTLMMCNSHAAAEADCLPKTDQQQHAAVQQAAFSRYPASLLTIADHQQHKQASKAAQQAYTAYKQQMLWAAKNKALDVS